MVLRLKVKFFFWSQTPNEASNGWDPCQRPKLGFANLAEQPTRPTHRWTLPCAPHWSPIARATVGQPPPAVSGGVRAEEPAANGAAAPTNRNTRNDGVWPPPAPIYAPSDPRACLPWWLGRPMPNLAAHGAIFARSRVPARNADHT